MDEFNIEINDTANSDAVGPNVVNSGNAEKIHAAADIHLIPLTPQLVRNNETMTTTKQTTRLPTESSLLTQLYEEEHIRVLYRIFIIVSSIILCKSTFDERLSGYEVTFCTKHLVRSFYDFKNVLTCWTIMFVLIIFLYVGYSIWATSREAMHAHGTRGTLKLWDLFWLWILCMYTVLMCIIPFSVTAGYPTMINQFVILGTQVVLLMKTYGFLRINVAQTLSYKPHSDMNVSVPDIRKFLYYLLAPTLVYKDRYPRSGHIDFRTVVSLIFDLTLISLWIDYLLSRVEEKFEYFAMNPITATGLVVRVLETILIGPALYCLCFYLTTHILTNLVAELLRFSDRHFYQDWWNSRDVNKFCRGWNTILYDYIDTHVRIDLKGLPPMISSIITSISMALIYDYVICLAVGVFIPITSLTCFISIPSLFLDRDWSILNLLFLGMFILGSGLHVTLLAVEYYARLNCPYEEDVWDLLELRSLHCNELT